MLSRENHTYDCQWVTKENNLFEFDCGHTVVTSKTTIIDFNNTDELDRWNVNKFRGKCPECEKKGELRLQQEKIKTEKEDCYLEMEIRHLILVDMSFGSISDRTYELRQSIDNKKYPGIYKKVVELMNQLKDCEKDIKDMDSMFESFKNIFGMKECFDILNDHVARTQSNLARIHSQLIYVIRAIYEEPSHLTDVDRNFIYYKANLVLTSIEAEYKRRDASKECQKEFNEKIIHFIHDNIDKTN